MKGLIYERNGNMKLRQYLEYEENVTVYREVHVGRALTIGGRPAFIIALREVGIPENDGPERPDCGDMSPEYKQSSCAQDGALKRIVQMHMLSVYRDCCCSEDDYEEAEMTNRDVFMQQIEEDRNEQNTAVCGFTVNGEAFDICEDHIDWEYLDEADYLPWYRLRCFDAMGLLPAEWLDCDADRLKLTTYEADAGMLNIDWQSEDLEIEAVIRPGEVSHIGALIECDLRELRAEDLGEHAKSGPAEHTVTDENGNTLTFRIHDVFAVSPEALIKGYNTCGSEDAEEGQSELADAEDDEWDEDFEDMEREFLESFSDGEKLLFIDFSTDEDIRLEMYAEEYLDAPANDCMMPGFGFIFGDDGEDRLSRTFYVNAGRISADTVSKKRVTVEVLSCTRCGEQ